LFLNQIFRCCSRIEYFGSWLFIANSPSIVYMHTIQCNLGDECKGPPFWILSNDKFSNLLSMQMCHSHNLNLCHGEITHY
jgi:hypothetical protein